MESHNYISRNSSQKHEHVSQSVIIEDATVLKSEDSNSAISSRMSNSAIQQTVQVLQKQGLQLGSTTVELQGPTISKMSGANLSSINNHQFVISDDNKPITISSQKEHGISGNTIQYITDENPEQAAAAVLQAVFGNNSSATHTYSTQSSTPATQRQVNSIGDNNVVSNSNGATYYYHQNHDGLVHVASGAGQPRQIVAQSGNTFLVQNSTMDAEGTPITHTTRASPITVQWLLDNYETAEGVSLPRCTLYRHYMRHCKDNRLEPVNAASFGKLIRSVFLGLKTRRLGTRGNSKYHYYGLRIKPGSPLMNFHDDFIHTAPMRQQPLTHNRPRIYKQPPMNLFDRTDNIVHPQSTSTGSSSSGPNADLRAISQNVSHYQQYLGDCHQLPQFASLEFTGFLPEGIVREHLVEFQLLYREHCETIMEIISGLQLMSLEAVWQGFFRNNIQNENSLEQKERNLIELESRLPKEKFFIICQFPQVLEYMKHCDQLLYQALVEFLIPDVLRPIPSPLTQAIRNFAKNLEGWMCTTLKGCAEQLKKVKVSTVSAFAQTLRRYTSLNHLAQAARAVLQNTSQINQMLTDLNRVDFSNVQDQASWVCGCDDKLIRHIEHDFKRTLQNQQSLEQWALWLENVVNQVLSPYLEGDAFQRAARQFLLKWSFYSSMVIRDLTLRSAASFGSFHLIRLLYDEYMFYLIEHRVAQATGQTSMAVMGQCFDESISQNSLPAPEEDPVTSEGEADEECDLLRKNMFALPQQQSGSTAFIINTTSSHSRATIVTLSRSSESFTIPATKVIQSLNAARPSVVVSTSSMSANNKSGYSHKPAAMVQLSAANVISNDSYNLQLLAESSPPSEM